MTILLAAVLPASAGCGQASSATVDAAAAAPVAAAARSGEAELAGYRRALLQRAFEVASALPPKPHIKTRCRKQEDVVLAALELGQPRMAEAMIPGIDNWRQGACWAALAYHYVSTGERTDVQTLLDRADKFARRAEQDWRRDRVRVKIAMTEALLGRESQARRLGQDVDASQGGRLEAVLALGDEKAFEEQLASLDAHIAGGAFDPKKNALISYASLYGRFYGDAERRGLIERKLYEGMADMPAIVRLDLLMTMGDAALAGSDAAKAGELAAKAAETLDGAAWPLEYYIPLAARVAELNSRCGRDDEARARVETVWQSYRDQYASIIDIYRVGALLPLAEACHRLGERDTALAIYKRALRESVVNVNSRPRVENLCDLCLSLAVSAVEPDAELTDGIQKVREGLGAPW